MLIETTIPTSELRAGDRIHNFCAILLDVTVESVIGGRMTAVRSDGSRFSTSVPADSQILVRVPRPVATAAA